MPVKDNPSGFLVGQAGPGRAWVLSRDEHMLLIGSTRSRKSRSVVLPTIGIIGSVGRESIVANDMKGEIYAHTAEWLGRQGYDVIRVDYREPSTGNQANPVAAVVSALKAGQQDQAAALARNIAFTVVYGGDRSTAAPADPMWQKIQTALITSLILAVATGQPPPGGMALREPPWTWPTPEQQHMGSVYASLLSGGPGGRRLDEWIAQFPPDHPAAEAYGPIMLSMDKTRASILTGAASDLNIWGDSSIKWLTAKQDHDLAAPGKRPTAVFLVIPDESETRYPLVTLYLQQTLQALVGLANSSGGRVPVRVNFLLDEFGNLPPLKGFEHTVTMALGRGIKLCLVVQDLAQLKDKYHEAAHTIKANCGTWLYLLTSDIETMKEISTMCGEYTTLGETNSMPKVYWTSSTTPGHATNTMNLMARSLVKPDELRRWPEFQSLVLQVRQNPAKLPLPDLSAWASVFPEIQQPTAWPEPVKIAPVPVWRPPPSPEQQEGTLVEEMMNEQPGKLFGSNERR